MVAEVDAIDNAGVALGKKTARLALGGGMARALPDLVKPARIAAIALRNQRAIQMSIASASVNGRGVAGVIALWDAIVMGLGSLDGAGRH
jgi:hypothetical protein